MKFGRQIEEYELPEWRGHYIPYSKFKKELQSIAAASQGLSSLHSVSLRSCSFQSPAQARSGFVKRALSIDPIRFQSPHSVGGDSNCCESPERAWLARLSVEALRVGEFVRRGLEGLQIQLKDLDRTSEVLGWQKRSAAGDVEVEGGDFACPALLAQDSGATLLNIGKLTDDYDAQEILDLRVIEALGLVAEGAQRLRSFANINHAALYKILKKHDKLLGTTEGLGVVFPRLLEKTCLAQTDPFDEIDEELRKLSLRSAHTEGLDASAEVARLAAGLGTSRGFDLGARRVELILAFFLGCSTALFLSIAVLLALPEASPDTFSRAYFLTPMPVFRVIFSVLLTLWCLGAVTYACDRADINHMFILNVDPRCRVCPEFFFARAAGLTTVWILIFGLYVVDYKWRVIPPVWASQGYNKRASVHFLLYPVVLLAITILGLVWPSRICRNRYKLSVTRSILRTISAPLYPVDFADNMLGDILTSLAKPLQDVPAAVCYLMSSHPQPEDLVRRFRDKGNTCSNETHHVLLPVIGGLPYVFRAMQCLRRFADTSEPRHLWNFGKYAASLLVVVVSSIWPQDFYLIVVVSVIATVYAVVWDIFLDWGLNLWDLLGSFSLLRRIRKESWAGSLRKSTSETILSGASGKRSHGAGTERTFQPGVYLACSFLNVIARSAWVVTLMPVTVLSGNIVSRVTLVSAFSSLEIIRRSMWAVIRIEHEQVANASGFRALLWVPTKLHVARRRPVDSAQQGLRANSLHDKASSIRQPLLES